MHWLVFAAIACFGSLIFHGFLKFTGSGFGPHVAAFYIQGGAFVASIILLLAFGNIPSWEEQDHKKVAMLCFAGAAIAVTNFCIFNMYRLGAPVSLASPIVQVGVALGTVFIGLLVFSETLSVIKASGVVLSVFAIFLMTR